MFATKPRGDLERIVHPAVRAAIDTWLDAIESRERVAVAVIPLLYEAGRERDFDVVITTACSADEQLRRVMTRVTLERASGQAARSLRSSRPRRKVRRADYAIWTDGTHENTEAPGRETLELLARTYHHLHALLRRAQRVHHQHRDRQRSDAARHRRQGAGHFLDLGMDIADEHRALRRERSQAGVPGWKELRGDRRIGDAIHADVDHRRRPASRSPA